MAVYTVDLDRHDESGGKVRVVEKRNRTWRCLAFPCSLLDAVQDKDEDDRSGVYVLWGYKAGHSKPYIYVGQSDESFKRLETHERTGDKEYWEHTVVFTSIDQGLHTTHVKYLEAELVRLARQNNRVELKNATNPRTAQLSGAVLDEVKEYFSDLLDCFAVLGIDFFEKSDNRMIDIEIEAGQSKSIDSVDAKPTKKVNTPVSEPPLLHIKRKGGRGRWGNGIKAFGYPKGDKFVVKAGSQAAKTLTDSALKNPRYKHIPELRNDLVQGYEDEKGIFIEPALKDQGRYYEFVRDFTFNSPSSASCQILGASSDGNNDWKIAGGRGRSLGDIRKFKYSEIDVEIPSSEQQTSTPDVSTGTAYDLFLSEKGVEARGRKSDDGFWVGQGSRAVKDEDVANSTPSSSQKLRTKFIADGTMQKDGDTYRVTKEANFITSSRAAGALLGGSYSGNKYWKKLHLSGH